MNSQDPIIYKAASTLYIGPGVGHNCSLALNQRVKVLLIKRLVGKFNGMFEDMLVVFFLLEDIDILYKTVERLYFDEQVTLIIHNLHVFILKKKGIKESDATGEGTRYSQTIKKNYECYAQELKDKAKERKKVKETIATKAIAMIPKNQLFTRGRLFVYTFTIAYFTTSLYLANDLNTKSERNAFNKAMMVLAGMNVDIKPIKFQ